MDRALRRRIEARFGEVLTGPVRQRHDETELRLAPGDVTTVMRALHDEPDLRFRFLADLCGVDTGLVMQVVYHLWSDSTPDWLRVIADGLPRDDPRVPSVTRARSSVRPVRLHRSLVFWRDRQSCRRIARCSTRVDRRRRQS